MVIGSLEGSIGGVENVGGVENGASLPQVDGLPVGTEGVDSGSLQQLVAVLVGWVPLPPFPELVLLTVVGLGNQVLDVADDLLETLR